MNFHATALATIVAINVASAAYTQKRQCYWTGCSKGGCLSGESEIEAKLCGNLYSKEHCCKWVNVWTPPAPTPTPPPTIKNCNNVEVVGFWKYLGGSNAASHTREYSIGKTFEENRKVNESWSDTVGSTVEAGIGFSFLGVGASVSASKMKEYTKSLQESLETSLAVEKIETQSYTFTAPGVVWQFQYSVSDSCGDAATIFAMDIVLTDAFNEPPCCLPGWFEDLAQSHGRCREESPDACPTKTTTTPTGRPSKLTPPSPTEFPTKTLPDPSAIASPNNGTWMVPRAVTPFVVTSMMLGGIVFA